PPENTTSFVEIARRDCLASARARERTSAVARDRVNTGLETQRRTEGAQQHEVTGTLGPEAKVVADDDDTRAQPLIEQLAHEPIGGPGCERRVEPPDVDTVNAERSHQLGATIHRGQKRRRPRSDH